MQAVLYTETHRLGFYRRDPWHLAVNVGSSCREESRANLEPDTYLTINENSQNLRYVGRRPPLASYNLW
jgi:hypothetical protein